MQQLYKKKAQHGDKSLFLVSLYNNEKNKQ